MLRGHQQARTLYIYCYIKMLLYPGGKNNKNKEILNFGTKKFTLL